MFNDLFVEVREGLACWFDQKEDGTVKAHVFADGVNSVFAVRAVKPDAKGPLDFQAVAIGESTMDIKDAWLCTADGEKKRPLEEVGKAIAVTGKLSTKEHVFTPVEGIPRMGLWLQRIPG